ncbi:MAG: transposase domain-containing protein [Desulfuromonadaceae bacterium]
MGCCQKPSSPQALHYYQGLAPYLENYLTNPDARLDNNVAERAIRLPDHRAQNWLFVGSENGGQSAAVFMSLILTCRHLNINPQEYLEDILHRIMSRPARRINELLPDL